MKREILFRGKRVDNGEWVFGYVVKGVFVTNWVYIFTSDRKFHEVIPESVGQFIGLHDKHESWVFEGDLFKTHYGSIYSVEFSDKLSLYTICRPIGSVASYPFADSERGEIIGNIHDNPELLTQ